MHLGQLRQLGRRLAADAARSRLYRFVADAPTVTMQRIKALVTGGLPTFVDVKDNFDTTEEVREDSWLGQATAAGRRVVFMGDDTWLRMFPTSFERSYPFPSFNVKDLHTVDRGCQAHLGPELERDDWDLLIAHFLGVDHVGHRFKPDHPAMRDKLRELDGVISSIVDKVQSGQLGDDVALVVLGDHGMTQSGDHGGASPDETDAALLVFSSRPLRTSPHASSTVYQVDLVPTLSVLLGVPAPFGSLGTVIADALFPSEDSELDLLRINAHQVLRYLQAYQLEAECFEPHWLAQQQHRLDQAAQLEDSSAILLYKRVLRDLLSTSRDKWATFDMTSIAAGLFLLLTTTAAFLWTHISPVHPAAEALPMVLFLAAYGQGLFSNSFIVAEPRVSAFLLSLSCVVMAFLRGTRHSIIASAAMVLAVGVADHQPADADPLAPARPWDAAAVAVFAALACASHRTSSLPLLVNASLLGAAWFGPPSIADPATLCIFVCVQAALAFPRFRDASLPLLLLGLAPLVGPRCILALLAALVFHVGLKTAPALPSFSTAAQCWLLSVYLFCATGHTSQFSTVRTTAAFVGFETYSYWRSGTMVFLNTFAGDIIGVTMCTSVRPRHRVPTVLRQFVALSLCRACLSALNAAIQRRHLMVWAIFAPKFVFDALSFVVVAVLGTAVSLCTPATKSTKAR